MANEKVLHKKIYELWISVIPGLDTTLTQHSVNTNYELSIFFLQSGYSADRL